MSAVGGDDRRTRAVRRGVVDVGPGVDELPRRREITDPRREKERRVTPLLSLRNIFGAPGVGRGLDHLSPDVGASAEIGVMGQERLDDVGMPLRNRPHQRGLTARRGRLGLGAGLEQLTDHVGAPAPRRRHQQRLPGEERRVRVRAGLEQPPDHRGAAILGGAPERRHAEVGRGVHVGAGSNHPFGTVVLVPVGGPVQRGRPVTLDGGHIRTLVECRSHVDPVALARRVRERSLGAAGAEAGDSEGGDRDESRQRREGCHRHPLRPPRAYR